MHRRAQRPPQHAVTPRLALAVGLLVGGVRQSDLPPRANDASYHPAHATASEHTVRGDALRSALRWIGRVDVGAANGARFSWSGAGFAARFSGRALAMELRNESTASVLVTVVVDGDLPRVLTLAPGTSRYPLTSGLAKSEHIVEVRRETEGRRGATQLRALTVVDGELLAAPLGPARRIEVIGDSTSAGWGARGQPGDRDCFASESHWDSFGAHVARALAAEVDTVASSGIGLTRNYGAVAGAPTILDLYARVLTNEPEPHTPVRPADAVLINIGANDINNRKGDPGAEFERAYRQLLAAVRLRHPHAHVMCMLAPTLGGMELTIMERHVRAAIAAMHDDKLTWFSGIPAQDEAMYGCANHPNSREQAEMGSILADALRAQLGWR